MRVKIACFFLFCFCAVSSFSQTEPVNQLDSLGKKHGKWIVWLNFSFGEQKDSSKAEYFRYAYFDHGENIYPMGPMGDKKWKLMAKENSSQKIGKIKILDGDYKWYDEKGVLRSHQVFEKGEHVLYKWYFSSGELNQVFDFKRKWQGQPLTYRIWEFKKDGSVKGRYYMRKEKTWQFFQGGPDSTFIDTNKILRDSVFVMVTNFTAGKTTSKQELIFVPVDKATATTPMETIKNGNSEQWYFGGRLFNAIPHGRTETWHTNGKQRSSGNFYYGKKLEMKYWDENGIERSEK